MATPAAVAGRMRRRSFQATWRQSLRRIAADEIRPRKVTSGATVFSDSIQVSSGTVTPPNPELPRIA